MMMGITLCLVVGAGSAWGQTASSAAPTTATPPTAGATTPAPAKPAPQRATAAPTVADYLAEGDALLASASYSRALSKYVLAWLDMPDNPTVIDRIADLYTVSGRLPEATRFYALAIKLNPGYEEAVTGLAQTYLTLQRPDQVVALLGDAGRQQRFAQSVRFHQLLGQGLLRTAKYDKAATELKTALTMAPDRGGLYGELGNAYYLANKPADAVEAYTQALARNPKDAVAALNRSQALEKLNRIPDAISSLELYVSLTNPAPDHPQRKRLEALKGTMASSAAK